MVLNSENCKCYMDYSIFNDLEKILDHKQWILAKENREAREVHIHPVSFEVLCKTLQNHIRIDYSLNKNNFIYGMKIVENEEMEIGEFKLI